MGTLYGHPPPPPYVGWSCIVSFCNLQMLVQVRRNGKIFRLIKGDARKIRIPFFLIKIIPTAIFIPYWSGVHVEMEDNNTWVSISPMRILHCTSSQKLKGRVIGQQFSKCIVIIIYSSDDVNECPSSVDTKQWVKIFSPQKYTG